MTKCSIFEVDFTTKQCTNKYIGQEKVVYYRCIQCQQKFSKTKSDIRFVPSVGWELEQNKRKVSYSLCKFCVDNMYDLLNGGK